MSGPKSDDPPPLLHEELAVANSKRLTDNKLAFTLFLTSSIAICQVIWRPMPITVIAGKF